MGGPLVVVFVSRIGRCLLLVFVSWPTKCSGMGVIQCRYCCCCETYRKIQDPLSSADEFYNKNNHNLQRFTLFIFLANVFLCNFKMELEFYTLCIELAATFFVKRSVLSFSI